MILSVPTTTITTFFFFLSHPNPFYSSRKMWVSQHPAISSSSLLLNASLWMSATKCPSNMRQYELPSDRFRCWRMPICRLCLLIHRLFMFFFVSFWFLSIWRRNLLTPPWKRYWLFTDQLCACMQSLCFFPSPDPMRFILRKLFLNASNELPTLQIICFTIAIKFLEVALLMS